jgi:hypothetical protein
MNTNRIRIDGWSNQASQAIYDSKWADEPELRIQYEHGCQCGGCSFYAPFNSDWGLCCSAKSRHNLETVFEHFTCATHIGEGWGPHSFTDDKELHCKCEGDPVGRH